MHHFVRINNGDNKSKTQAKNKSKDSSASRQNRWNIKSCRLRKLEQGHGQGRGGERKTQKELKSLIHKIAFPLLRYRAWLYAKANATITNTQTRSLVQRTPPLWLPCSVLAAKQKRAMKQFCRWLSYLNAQKWHKAAPRVTRTRNVSWTGCGGVSFTFGTWQVVTRERCGPLF